MRTSFDLQGGEAEIARVGKKADAVPFAAGENEVDHTIDEALKRSMDSAAYNALATTVTKKHRDSHAAISARVHNEHCDSAVPSPTQAIHKQHAPRPASVDPCFQPCPRLSSSLSSLRG